MNDKISITNSTIENIIYDVRGVKVMLDYDLAAIYGVETRTLNQAVKRNIERFPEDFMFRLTEEEWNTLIQSGMRVCQKSRTLFFMHKSPDFGEPGLYRVKDFCIFAP